MTEIEKLALDVAELKAELHQLRQRCGEMARRLSKYAQVPGYREVGNINERADLVYSVRDELADMAKGVTHDDAVS